MPKPLSREARIYLALWRKAYLERDEALPLVSIKASNYSVATSMRLGLYRAIRPYRNGQVFDPDLEGASEYFVPTLPKLENPLAQHTITLTPRRSLSELEIQLAAMGLGEESLSTSEETRMASELKALTSTATPRPENPFFKRED